MLVAGLTARESVYCCGATQLFVAVTEGHSRCFDSGFVVSAFSCKRPHILTTRSRFVIAALRSVSRNIASIEGVMRPAHLHEATEIPHIAYGRTIFYILPVSTLPSTLLSTNNLRRFRFYSASDRAKLHDDIGMQKDSSRAVFAKFPRNVISRKY
jgi:hypothetical protein